MHQVFILILGYVMLSLLILGSITFVATYIDSQYFFIQNDSIYRLQNKITPINILF